MKPETELLLTTINAFSVKTFIRAMLGQEKVHTDHNYYFSFYTLKQLMEKHNLKCEEIYYAQDILGKGFPLNVDKCFSIIPKVVSSALADTLFVRARLKENSGGYTA